MTDEKIQKEMLERMNRLEGNFQELINIVINNFQTIEQKFADNENLFKADFHEVKMVLSTILREMTGMKRRQIDQEENLLELQDRLEKISPRI